MEKFKREINGSIRRKLMEIERQLGSIEEWYDRTIALNRNQKESKQEEERLKRKEEKKISTY